MKPIIIFIVLSITISLSAQRNRTARMAPAFSKGYYVNNKGDTLKGEIQNNPTEELEFYRAFFFRGKGGTKPRAFDCRKVKAYGFDSRHFVSVTVDNEKHFIERLVRGRLNFYEYKFNGKMDGYPGIESSFFIKDTRAEGDDVYLKELRQMSTRYYKKALKPYMKDQPMIWSDLDKYSFDKGTLLKSISEFNRFYTVSAN